MGNIYDYIAWRGDLTFAQDSMNEVDNLLFCLLAYVDFTGAAPVPGENFTSLREVSKKFYTLHTEEEVAKSKMFFWEAPLVLRDAAKTERFRDVLVGNFVDKISSEKTLQMSAVEFRLPDGSSFVAYRGTDDRIDSWKEDFFLASGEVSAQIEAAKYLNKIGVGNPEGKLYVGGHSKGGNVAVYAAAACNLEVQKRIVRVYDNDGPGFREEFLTGERYRTIESRIQRTIPEESMVGILLDHTVQPVVIESSRKAIMQHDGMSWQISGNHFMRKETLAASSNLMDQTMKRWLEQYDDATRIQFINDIFAVLEAPGEETLTGLQTNSLSSIRTMSKQYEALNSETKEMVDLLLKSLVSNWSDQLTENLRKRWDGKGLHTLLPDLRDKNTKGDGN